MELDEYRVLWDSDTMNWDIAHVDRGVIGAVWPDESGRFEAKAIHNGAGVPVAQVWTFKAAVEQVIWYDRAMNQEVE